MKILVVDDDPTVLKFVSAVLSNQGYEVFAAPNGRQALELAASHDFDLVFCDVMMEGLSGFDVLRAFRKEQNPDTQIILMTGQASVEAAIEAVEQGANDYICKPFSPGVVQAIAANCEHRQKQNRLIKVQATDSADQEILGKSPGIIDVVKSATRVASTDLPVVIRGESGTGKELVARLIHLRSPRANKPFVAVNCGALPDTLLESELFGHTRGAFTGADQLRRGLFEEADGGTLLLDEVTETSAAFQVKLLRTLQEGEIRPLGTNAKKRVNVRIVAATNRDPHALVEKGLLRQDLLYRLQGMTITLPPVRERRDDIPTLVFAFLCKFKPTGRELSITKDALLALERYDWPGNVRELGHLMQRLASLSNGVIQLSDLPAEVVSAPQVRSVIQELLPSNPDHLPSLQEMESAYVVHVLNAVAGNKSRAANVLGIDRKTLYRIIGHHEEQMRPKETDLALVQ